MKSSVGEKRLHEREKWKTGPKIAKGNTYLFGKSHVLKSIIASVTNKTRAAVSDRKDKAAIGDNVSEYIIKTMDRAVLSLVGNQVVILLLSCE